jgi:TonB-linked SusC/RagA family outer membrane protein
MNKAKVLLLMAIMACTSVFSYAQSQTVKGKVLDNEGLEVIGGSVVVKGVTGGTVTDLNGNYELTVNDPKNAVLVFSYIGYESLEVKLEGRSVLNVTLQPSTEYLEEAVSIGYATVKRKDLTGSVASVNTTELSKVPVSDVGQALSGRLAGVQVTQAEGEPGAAISIRVRGGISITQSNEPLYIIDGFPSEDGMSTLDPADIESIDVMKDASATAIYGARGANGVVVITTKQGGKKGGRATVNFDAYVGFKKIAKTLDVLSPLEYVKLDYERNLYNLTEGTAAYDEAVQVFEENYGKYTDIEKNYLGREGVNWQNETLGRTALQQNYRLSVQGGNKNLGYKLSYSYFDEEGAMVYSGNEKHNISLNLKSQVKDWLKLTANINYDQRKIYGMGTSENGDRFNKMQHIIQYRPTMGIKGTDEELIGHVVDPMIDDSGNVMRNPLVSAREEIKDRQLRTFNANAGAVITLAKGLTFTNTTGMRYQTRRNDIFYGEESVMASRSSINGSIEYREYGTFQTSNVLSYNFEKGIHNFTAMVGQEYVNSWSRSAKASANNFPNDEIGLADMSLGTPGTVESSEAYNDILLSFFGRINYNIADKYLFTASVRADGSSKFGANNKWGYFPAVSAAWRASEEDFIKDLNVFSDLKVRVGYGMAGNNRIGNYGSLAVLSSVTAVNGNGSTPGYVANQIPNPNLMWEANKTFNVGLDLGFFDQRLTIAPEFYVNRSSNLLLNAKLPTSSGYSSMIINAGETQNTGLDLTINSINIDRRNFSWRTAVTLSHNQNKVNKLTGEEVQLWEASFGYNQNTHIIGVNQPLGQFYGYVTDGIYQVSDFNYDAAAGTYTLKDGIPYLGDKAAVKPGMWKFKNVDGSEDNVINENDKTVIGNAFPILYGGINNTFTFKGFDLSIYLTYSLGNEVLNATKLTNSRAGKLKYSVLSTVDSNNRWTLVNNAGKFVTDPEELAAMNAGKTVACLHDLEEADTYIHSWGVEDASYLKISNVTLGYTFPRKWMEKIGLQTLRLYVTGANLYTFTKYSGFDPEVSTFSSGLTPGVDFGAYPRSRSVVFGVNVSF